MKPGAKIVSPWSMAYCASRIRCARQNWCSSACLHCAGSRSDSHILGFAPARNAVGTHLPRVSAMTKVDGRRAAERPLPPGLALHARARLVAGDHLARAHLRRDPLGRRSDGLADAGEHVGDGALRDREAEQALADLGQPLVADHLAAVQVGDDRRDARTERRALGHVGGRACRHARLATRARGAEQLDARRDRPDRRNVDMVVLFRELLSGLAEHGTARTALGVEAPRRVRASRRACARRRGGPCAAACSPAARRSPSARATAAARSCPASSAAAPSLASSSAMRAISALICASSSSIRASSCCTSGFKLSASSESSFSGAIPSLNQPVALRSIRYA